MVIGYRLIGCWWDQSVVLCDRCLTVAALKVRAEFGGLAGPAVWPYQAVIDYSKGKRDR